MHNYNTSQVFFFSRSKNKILNIENRLGFFLSNFTTFLMTTEGSDYHPYYLFIFFLLLLLLLFFIYSFLLQVFYFFRGCILTHIFFLEICK